MTRRPAVTLMEVLIAMFIMAIGMLALLALFPVGAASMAQALKDDRCASTAAMAENVAILMPVGTPLTPGGIRHDTAVTTALATSTLVYVDPYGFQSLLVKLGGVIPRVAPNYITSQQLADRWFSLPDDLGFLANGTPQLDGSSLDRGRRYSYAYLLRQLPTSPTNLIQLFVVVYAGRPVKSLASPATEWLCAVTAVLPATGPPYNAVQITPPPPMTTTTAKRGGWMMDLNGNFYRITNITGSGANTILETQQNLQVAVGQNIIIMDYVAEVFDKGTGWRP